MDLGYFYVPYISPMPVYYVDVGVNPELLKRYSKTRLKTEYYSTVSLHNIDNKQDSEESNKDWVMGLLNV